MVDVNGINFIGEEIEVFENEFYGDCNIGFNYIELMQYTGFKDDNGKDIYEGDKLILTVEFKEIDGMDEVQCDTGTVEWYEGGWIVYSDKFSDDRLYDWSFDSVVVIGNIHENSEL